MESVVAFERAAQSSAVVVLLRILTHKSRWVALQQLSLQSKAFSDDVSLEGQILIKRTATD